jgi:Mn-dependent DtxR family transcriptional regulator
MTQELIANTLGVRREGVMEAAGKLQRAGLIRHQRVRIAVLDRRAWSHGRASEVAKTEFERLPSLRRW